MATVRLQLPAEAVANLDLPYDGSRDLPVFTVAIETLNVITSIVSLAALKPQLQALAAGIRNWMAGRVPTSPVVLSVKGPGIDIKIDLPPNVSKSDILAKLAPLAEAP